MHADQEKAMTVVTAAFARSRQRVLLDKGPIRSSALSLRTSLYSSSTPLKPDLYDRVFDQFYKNFLTPVYQTSKPVVAGYYPIGSEFDVVPLLQRFYGHGHVTCLPVAREGPFTNESPLVFWEWIPGSATTKGRFNIPIPIRDETHPVRPDLVITPLIAFDRSGRRLGYGGGYYDRAIEKLKAYRRTYRVPGPEENWKEISTFAASKELPLLICGIGFDGQLRDDLDQMEESHDQRMDLVITEKAIYSCRTCIESQV